MPKAKKVGDQWSVLAYLGKDENGKKQYKRVSGDNKNLVELEAAKLAVEAKKKSTYTTKTVGEILDSFISDKSNVMSPSTVKAYLSMRNHHYEELEDKYVEDLKASDIQQMINKEALTHSPKTVRNIYGMLSSALAEYYPELVFRVRLPAKNKPSIQIPTDEMLHTLLSVTEGTELNTAIKLAAFLGLRRSEICALNKKDIDFKQKTISINKAAVLNSSDQQVIKKPKTYAGERTIVVPDFLLSDLKAIKTEQIVNLKVYQVSNQFFRLTEKLNYDIRFHDLRHYNASIMLMLNVPNKYAQERIGHATDNMLKTVYQHTLEKKHFEIANTLNDYFSQTFANDNKKKKRTTK